MTKLSAKILIAAVTAALSASSSWATIINVSTIGTNITTNDGVKNSSYSGGSPALGIGNEDNETEGLGGNTVTEQSWDLEAMYWNSSTKQLTIIGGFNYLTGNSTEAAGDLFIGDNYVLDLSRNGENLASTGTFKTIMDYTKVVPPNYVVASSPYQYLSGGQKVGVNGTYTAGVIENWNDIKVQLGLQAWKNVDKHYALVINTAGTTAASLINAGSNLHFTLECGNDLITGKATPVSVPEPATISLLLIGLAALGLTKRKN